MQINPSIPSWYLPFLSPARYKVLKGGRAGGKSHVFAQDLVVKMCANPTLRAVSIREVQKSLKYSAKQLIEDKISSLGASDMFEITQTEIRRKGGGVCIFQGMQDHTADSVKSLEGFDIAWVEEAQNLSARSLKLLRPTIRKAGSELWFSYNPDQKTDPVDEFFSNNQPENTVIAHINYDQNPWLDASILDEIEHDRRTDPDGFNHVWLGDYNTRLNAQVFAGKWVIDEFTPQPDWDGAYFGADWGFASDPTTLVECWIYNHVLYVRGRVYAYRLELDDIGAEFTPHAGRNLIYADSARPETISYVSRTANLRIQAAQKGAGSVEDGIAFMRKFDKIVIHADSPRVSEEFRLYSYKTDRLTGDIKPDIIDAHNHAIDAIRYALSPLIHKKQAGGFITI